MPIMVTKVEIENTLEAEKSQEKEVKEDNEQEMNTSLEQNQGNKTSDLIENQSQEENIVDKVKSNNLTALFGAVMAGIVIIGGLIWSKKK